MIVEPNIAPLAKRLAEENNVNWRGLSGSGSDGRIIERDVLEYLAKVMAGDEDVNPTAEPVPEGMEAWPEEDTKGFFEAQVDASTSDSGTNWASATDEDVLGQVEEELDFSMESVEAEADDLLKQSGVGVFSSSDDLLNTVEDSFNLELGDEIFDAESENAFDTEFGANSLIQESPIEDSSVDEMVQELDLEEATEDLIIAEETSDSNFELESQDLISDEDISEDVFLFDDDSSEATITEVDAVVEDFLKDDDLSNLFSEEEISSEDVLIDQQLADGSSEASFDLNDSDLFASSVEEASAKEVDEDLASLFVDDEVEEAELDLNPGLDAGLEDILATNNDLEENLEISAEEIIEEPADDILAELNEEEALSLEANEDLTADITKEFEIEAVDASEEIALEAEQDSLSPEADSSQEFLSEDDIAEMESLEAILEDFEDDLDNDVIEGITVADIEDELEPDQIEPDLAAAGIAAAGVAAIASDGEEVEEITAVNEAEAIEEILEATDEVEVVEEIEAIEEVEEIAAVEELETLAEADEVIEEPLQEAVQDDSLAAVSSQVFAAPQASYGVLLRRQIDLSRLLEASSEVAKELADTVPNSVFILKAAAKAAQKSGLADESKLAFANFEDGTMQIRAIKSARSDSFVELSKQLSANSINNLEDVDLVIADIAELELDEAVLNIAAPVMTLGRVEYGFDGARSVLSISGDISIEAGAKFISIFAELIESPIRLLV